MNLKRKKSSIPLIIVLSLILTAGLVTIFASISRAAAPYVVLHTPAEHTPEIDLKIIPKKPIEDILNPPDTTITDEPSPPPSILVTLHESDVSRGSLILVNPKHSIDIPDESELVLVRDRQLPYYSLGNDEMMLSSLMIDRFNEMLEAFHAETGRNSIVIVSAFRDIEKQGSILKDRIAILGREEALKWASEPGYSEHHSGLALDLGIIENGIIKSFRGTKEYAWFRDNSYKYGFILRYTADKTEITGTAFEPWHYRYVGMPHSYFINKNSFCLEEYIEFLTEFSPENSYKDYCNDVEYEIYYTEDTEMIIPPDCEYTISGNNVNGFIVTIKHSAD